MKRKEFLKVLAVMPLASIIMKLNALDKISSTFMNTQQMPVLFLGHGSPMNAIEENEFVRGFRKIADELPAPKAILCISAHWETRGTYVTAMQIPPTIHDFGGFPEELFSVQYPAPGNPELAKQIKSTVSKTNVELDYKWGLDHGAWSVIKHLYPDADIPVLEMSIDYTRNAQYHYTLAKELSSLRQKGVLIIGSGNIIHNLGKVDWNRLNETNYAYDWASEAKEKINKFIMDDNHQSLINYKANGKAFQLAIPTPEHYLPLLYTLALKESSETVSIFNDKAIAGSLTMTSVKIS